MTPSSTTQPMTTPMPEETTTPEPICNYFSSGFKLDDPDPCAYGVFAGAGALVIIAIVLMCVGFIKFCSCCCKQQRRDRTVIRTKPLITTQAASWFTSSLTSKFELVYKGINLKMHAYNISARTESTTKKQPTNKQIPDEQNHYPDLSAR